jgi:hypothetical protein
VRRRQVKWEGRRTMKRLLTRQRWRQGVRLVVWIVMVGVDGDSDEVQEVGNSQGLDLIAFRNEGGGSSMQ